VHQKPDQMEKTRWEGQNFSEVVAPEEEEEEEGVFYSIIAFLLPFPRIVLSFVAYFVYSFPFNR
jgi:hypothetical protein